MRRRSLLALPLALTALPVAAQTGSMATDPGVQVPQTSEPATRPGRRTQAEPGVQAPQTAEPATRPGRRTQADPQAPPTSESATQPGRGRSGKPRSRKMASRRYDDLTPGQKRRADLAMARDGERSVPPEEARRRWDATPERARRAATKRVARANGDTARREGRMEGDGGSRREARTRAPRETGQPAPEMR